MRSPKVIWSFLLIGTSATVLSMTVGLTELLRERGVSDATRNAFLSDLLNGDFTSVPLQHSKVVTTRRIGYAGAPSPLATEFVGILRTPKAEDILAQLAEHGSAGARLYALCGLTTIRSPKLPRYLSLASTDAEVVALIDGCSMSVTRVKDAAISRYFWRECEKLVDGALPNPASNPTGLRSAG